MNSDHEEPSEPQADPAECTVLDWPRRSGQLDYFRKAVAARLRRRRRIHVASGCAAALLVAAAVAWRSGDFSRSAATTPWPAAASLTEPRSQTLADGSVVELRDGANIVVDFSSKIRRVTLESGEAHFSVARNKTRPFVVSAGGVEVRAVGTAFDVDLSGKNVDVLVTDGRVAVERLSLPATTAPAPMPPRPPLAYLDAGQRVVLPSSRSADRIPEVAPAVVPVSSGDVERRLAWRVARFEFSGTPLAEAIELINAHSGTRLVLGDPDLGSVELSGILRANNVDALLQMLASNYAITAERQATGEIVLRRRR